jgi:hypothetical protein
MVRSHGVDAGTVVAQTTIRMRASQWVTEVQFTDGIGFTSADESVARYLNARAAEESITTTEAALVLARTEYVGVEEIVA